MGAILLFVSLLSIAVGTWKLIGLAKAETGGSKVLWIAVTVGGIGLFMLLKVMSDLPVSHPPSPPVAWFGTDVGQK